ncbi:hypothetical protein AAY473_024893, partial [Plecturocebus cupreus]
MAALARESNRASLCRQAGVQWRNLSSLQPLPPGFKRCLGIVPSCIPFSDLCECPPTALHRVSLCRQAGVYRRDFSSLQPLPLVPSDSPALASRVSQSAGITDVSHCAQPQDGYLKQEKITSVVQVQWLMSVIQHFGKPRQADHLRQSLTLSPGWSTVARSWLTATSVFQFQAILLPQPPKQLGLQARTTMNPANFWRWSSGGDGSDGERLQTQIQLCSSQLLTFCCAARFLTGHNYRWPRECCPKEAEERPSRFQLPERPQRMYHRIRYIPSHKVSLAPEGGRLSLALSPRLECSGRISAHYNSHLSGSSDPPVLSSREAGITGDHNHAWLIFVFVIEMGFHHVGQAGLELLTSDDSPTSASQNTGITGMRHHTWPAFSFLHSIVNGTNATEVAVLRVSFAFLHHQGGWPSSSSAPALTQPPPYMPALCPQHPGLPEGLQQLPWLTVTLCFLDFNLDLSGVSTTDRSSESSQFRSMMFGRWAGSSACAVNPPFPHTPAPCPQHPRLPEGFFSSSHVLTVTLYFLDCLCFIQGQLLGDMSSEQVLHVFN